MMKRMRSEVAQGLQYLSAARQRSGSTNLNIADHDPGDSGHTGNNPLKRCVKHTTHIAFCKLPVHLQLVQRRRGRLASSLADCKSLSLSAVHDASINLSVGCIAVTLMLS